MSPLIFGSVQAAEGLAERLGSASPFHSPLLNAGLTRSAGPHASALLGPTGDASPNRPMTRLKLWDIAHKYHCPIIGTCLTVEDLRRILEQTTQCRDSRVSDFEIHVNCVAAATDKNPLSIAIHKSLERRYAACVRRYAKARDPEALIAQWSESLATGEVPAGLWALMTHPRADERVLDLAYQDVHMLSHQIGATQHADLGRMSEMRLELERVRRQLDTHVRRSRQQGESREARIRELEQLLASRDAECGELRATELGLRARLAEGATVRLECEVANLSARVQHLVAESSELRRLNSELETARAAAEQLAQSAEQARDEAVAEREATERLIEHLTSRHCDQCDATDCERRQDLAGRLVLCIGGRKQLVDQYRAVVAGCNGRFDHHDGGLEDSHQRLEAMLAAADLVVCATDCVSHAAYQRTKLFCKRHDKPHALLRSSGVSSFALAIEHLTSRSPVHMARAAGLVVGVLQ